VCSPFPSQSWQRMLFTFWCFLADWSFSVACSNETFQNFDERQTQKEPNGSTFFLPEPTVLPNWKENEMKKVHTSLTQHSCLMFIDRNTICMSNYCTQHTSYISSKYMLFGSEKNFVVGGWRWKYSWGRGTESSRDQLLQDAIWFWRVEKYSHLGKFMGHIR
jgi:hypothetical protein